MDPQIYAAIDVGSNSVRLLIARAQHGKLIRLCSDRSTTRLWTLMSLLQHCFLDLRQ